MRNPDQQAEPQTIDRDELIEAACQARCMVPNIHWADGMTEGVQAIERMLAEKQIAAIISRLQPSYADGYAKAIEDAAKVALDPCFVQARDDEWDTGFNDAKRIIAAAIRALAGKDAEV